MLVDSTLFCSPIDRFPSREVPYILLSTIDSCHTCRELVESSYSPHCPTTNTYPFTHRTMRSAFPGRAADRNFSLAASTERLHIDRVVCTKTKSLSLKHSLDIICCREREREVIEDEGRLHPQYKSSLCWS